MKTSLLALIICAGAFVMSGLFSSCNQPEAKYEVSVTTPVPASKVTPPLVIQGKYGQSTVTLNTVHVELLRYSDNLSWTGLAWGSSTDLTTELDTAEHTWTCNAPLPTGAELPDGWYLLTARANYTDGSKATRNSVFSVGITPPPVTPTLYGWGYNDAGRLGAGDFLFSNQPFPVFTRGVLDGKLIAAVAAGSDFTLALTTEGRVYAWGSNEKGQLGLAETTQSIERFFPAAVSTSGPLGGQKIASIAAGKWHSLAADDIEGRVFSWGANFNGELGIGTTGTYKTAPQQVAGLPTGEKVVQVTAGEKASYALTKSGKVFAWGDNGYGQLGNGSTTSSSTPVAVTGPLAAKVVIQLSAGGHHVLALTSDGEVFAWGEGTTGQLGNNSTTSSSTPVLVGGALTGKVVTAISAGLLHSLALSEGKLFAWGWNFHGQIGSGAHGPSASSILSPLEISGPLAGKKVTMIEAGDHFSFAATEQGQVFAWGQNEWGGLAMPASGSGGPDLPTEADFSGVLSNGRVLLGLSAGKDHAIAISGFPPKPNPEIEVEAQSVELTDGATMSFGNVGQGSSNPVFITVRNRGTSDLTGLSATIGGAGFSGVFTQPALAPNGETGFYVFFNPNTAGAASGTVQITSNDADENPFDITLNGSAYSVGQVDTAFDPGVTGDVQAISVQPDGKVIVGGTFIQVAGPTARNRCARLDGVTGAADSFDPNVDNFINCTAVLPDGKVMIGGTFTAVGVEARSKLARLNADGTLDTTYNAQITGTTGVRGMALQSDGKLIIVGNISSVAGFGVTFIARLNPDGTRDATFAPTLNAPPIGVAVRGDGQVLIWGQFSIANGLPRSSIALLNGVDGTTDASFDNPLITLASSQLDAAALQRDGKVLVGGRVSSVNGTTRLGMCRLNADGTLDTGFDPNINGTTRSIALQADGSMIISGDFTSVGGQTRNRIAKLKANGSLDQYFDPGSTTVVKAVALQGDGKVLLTSFGQIAGQSRGFLARVTNDLPTQSLGLTNNGATIEWLRGGSAPETNLVTFDVSTDGGMTWTPVGSASRITFPQQGWTLTDGSLPPTGHIRARAYPHGSQTNGSFSIVETITAYGTPPDIVVTENSTVVPHGSTRQFGVVATGTGSSLMQLIIQNTGGTTLTGLGGVTLDDDLSVVGQHQTQFQLIRPAANSLAPGATTTMAVIYQPKTSGRHAAILRLPSNDADTNPFALFLTGLGSQPFTTHKQLQTGDSATADNTPSGFSSGETILGAYATGTDANSTDGDGTFITPPSSGGGGSPFSPESEGGDVANDGPASTFFFNYRRNKLALADVTFQVEWSDTLAANDWHTEGITEAILSDDDHIQQIQATIPAGSSGRRFVRLKMTRL